MSSRLTTSTPLALEWSAERLTNSIWIEFQISDEERGLPGKFPAAYSTSIDAMT
jgi:hypothetical protein